MAEMATMSPSRQPGREKEQDVVDVPFYSTDVESIRESEYPMLQGTTYLDHAGTTLYAKSLIDAYSRDLSSNLFGNPHSASMSSQLSSRRIEDIRLQALRFFNADPNDFDLVFVANATAGIKLVMESFREHDSGFWYGYSMDSHTSLVGVREAAEAGYHCFSSDSEIENWIDGMSTTVPSVKEGTSRLFAYPAQSNMNGRRLPLAWTKRLRASKHKGVYSLLDAAALVSTSPLDLSDASRGPDFTVLSFYKIFGFPDLGALIIRKESSSALQKRKYFGGGTVEMVTCERESWHINKQGDIHEQLEDGTLPIHSIIALDSAFNVHRKLFNSMGFVSLHTQYLAENLNNKLIGICHYNGVHLCVIYKDPSSSYSDVCTQGPIIALNLQNSRGEWISNTEVEKLASIKNIQIRSGGLCNPGGTASSLKLEPWEMKRNFSAGHRCGNENDIVGGKPTGSLRVSLGAMSSLCDVNVFVEFVEEFFVDHGEPQQRGRNILSAGTDFFIETLNIYPIKSCGGWTVPSNMPWDVREEGLAWDREWCLVHQGTRTALSQKRYPKMALIRPRLDLTQGVLQIGYHGPLPPAMPAEINVPLSDDPRVFQSSDKSPAKPTALVCDENIIAQIYASSEIATFFTTIVGTPCTLARFPVATAGLSTRHSKVHLIDSCSRKSERPILLSNESPILTISRSSLNRLNEQIKLKDGKAAHASVFRANIVVAEDPASSPGSEQPYAEDQWQSLHIGSGIVLDVLGGCRRCQMVCVDQYSAERNEEPFVTLAKTRRKQGKVFFGVHTALAADSEQVSRIQVGDKVVPLTDG